MFLQFFFLLFVFHFVVSALCDYVFDILLSFSTCAGFCLIDK